MDWFLWLSKTRLEVSLRHEYALVLTYNQLQEEDISYFNHNFLQSMGISIAKHRLEILKLARRHKLTRLPSLLWLVIAVKSTQKFLAKSVHGQNEAALTQPRENYSWRWKETLLKRSRLLGKQHKPVITNGSAPAPEQPQPVLLLTYGSPVQAANSMKNSFSSPRTPEFSFNNVVEEDEEIRWEDMFTDLKPT